MSFTVSEQPLGSQANWLVAAERAGDVANASRGESWHRVAVAASQSDGWWNGWTPGAVGYWLRQYGMTCPTCGETQRPSRTQADFAKAVDLEPRWRYGNWERGGNITEAEFQRVLWGLAVTRSEFRRLTRRVEATAGSDYQPKRKVVWDWAERQASRLAD